MPSNGHVIVQAIVDHGALPRADAYTLLRNARLACRSWARALGPHARRIRLDLSAAPRAVPAAFPCASDATFDLRATQVDPASARASARAVGGSLWRTLTTVRIVVADGDNDDDSDSSNNSSSDAEEEEDEAAAAAATEPQPHQQPPPRPNKPPSLLLACGQPRRASASDLDAAPHHHHPRSAPAPSPQQLRRWLVAGVARGAAAAAAASTTTTTTTTTPPALACLDLAGGPLPRPGELRRLLAALPRPPRTLRVAAPTDTARRLSAAHVAAVASSSPAAPLERLELVFRTADGVPARPLVLFGGNGSTNNGCPSKRLVLTYTGPPELAGSVQAFNDDDDDENDESNNNPPSLTSLTRLALDMVALPLLPRVFAPLAPNLTVLRLRQREPFTAAEAALIGRASNLRALSLSPLPWALVPLAVGRSMLLRELDLGIVDGGGGGGGGGGGVVSDDDDDDDDAEDDDTDTAFLMSSPAPRLARAPGSVLGLGLTACSRMGSLIPMASMSLLTPTATANNTNNTNNNNNSSPATAALLKALRRSGARLTFLSVDAARPLSLRPADVAAIGRACPHLEHLELGARLEQGTSGFGAAFPGLRSLSLRGARTEAADAWSPAEWNGGGSGDSGVGDDDDNNDNSWSFWSRAPRHRRAMTDPVVLVPSDLPRALETLEVRDVWACVPASLEDPIVAASASSPDQLELPTPFLRSLSLRYVGACPGCAPPLPMLRWPTGAAGGGDDDNQQRREKQQQQQQQQQEQQQQRRASAPGSRAGSATLRDWLLRPLLTLAEAALSPSADKDDGENDNDGNDDNDAQSTERDQQPRRATAAQPVLQPTLVFLPANSVLPSLLPSSSSSSGLTALELALPCDGPCCACGGGSSCSASRRARVGGRRSSFSSPGGGAGPAASAAATAPPLPPPLARAASSSSSSGALAAAVAMRISGGGAMARKKSIAAAALPPPLRPPTPLRLTLHLPRAARRATSPDATAAHLSRALSASLARALALIQEQQQQQWPVVFGSLRLLCHGDVRCGGESGPGCAGKEAALLRESAARRLGVAAAVSEMTMAPSAVAVDFVHDPLPHLSGFRGMQCSCRSARAAAAAAGGGGGGSAA